MSNSVINSLYPLGEYEDVHYPGWRCRVRISWCKGRVYIEAVFINQSSN